jgi:hypothetical protein
VSSTRKSRYPGAPVVEDDLPPYRRSTRDSDYWLRQCEGFIVETPGGRVGIIEEIRYHSTADRPDYLVVRAGRIGRRQILIPVREIEEIIPRRQIVRLRADHPDAA